MFQKKAKEERPLTFRDLRYGQLIITEGDTSKIWCKTPKADMNDFCNGGSVVYGELCNAVCINSEKTQYMNCNPDTYCTIVEIKKHLKKE